MLDLLQLAATREAMLRHLQDNALQEDLLVARSELSLSINFKHAHFNLCNKYSLSNDMSYGQ